MVFDPDQDPEEKRAVRQGYRALTKKIEGSSVIILSYFAGLTRLSLEYRSNPKDLQASDLLAGVQRVDGLFGKGSRSTLRFCAYITYVYQSRDHKKLR